MSQQGHAQPPVQPASLPMIYVDLKRCIGCDACSTACKQENNVQLGQRWTRVYGVETGAYPAVDVRVLPMFCHQCGNARCESVCNTLGHRAIIRRADGILYVDNNRCIGCQQCVPACPYGAMFFNSETQKAEKCHFCMHRIDAGLLPACVITCMGVTREFGTFSQLAARHPGGELMGYRVSVMYGNLGEAPPRDSGTAGYPSAVECHR